MVSIMLVFIRSESRVLTVGIFYRF